VLTSAGGLVGEVLPSGRALTQSSPLPLRSIPLRVALLAPLVLAVVGGAGGVSYFSWRAGQRMALQLARQLKSEVNHRVEEHLHRYLQAPLQVNALNREVLRWGLLPNLAAPQLEVLEAYFARQLQQFPKLSDIGFVSVHGGFVTARRHADGSIWTYHTPGLKPGSVQGRQRGPESGDPTGLTRQLSSLDLQQLSWFPEILQQAEARRTWLVSNFFVESSHQKPERLILTALPLANAEGQVYGSLVASLPVHHLQAVLEDLQAGLGYPGAILLLDGEGQVVASTEKLSPQPLLLAVQEQVGSWEVAASQGLLRLEVDGIPHWVQVKAIQEEGGLNFYFLHGIPESTLLVPVYSSTQQAALWGGGLLLGFLGVGILLDKALSHPLRRLTQIAEQFVHSGIPALASMDPGPIQEVQTLAKAWQQAAANQQALLDRLWQQQQQYCAVVEQQTELICRFRPDTSITYANPAYLRFFGRSAEETIGRRWRDSLPPEEREAVLQALAVLTPEHPFHRSEREYPGEDGQSRWVSWVDRGIFDSQDQLVEILSVGREITEQKRAQQQLEALNCELEAQVALRTAQLEQALRFEAVLRSLSGQMVASLKEGEILEEVVKSLAEALNLTGCHILLTSADGSSWIRACSFPEKADPASLNDPELGHLLHSHALPWEVHWCSQRGGRWVHLLACSLRNHQERLGLLLLERQQEFSEAERQLAYQVVNLCALALRQARLYEETRAQVKELERLNLLKDDFLSTVSHELRTPMANVRMALQMLPIARDDPKKQQHYFAIALKECNRQIDLINDLLDMQRLSAEKYLLQPEEIFLPHYLRDLVATAQPLAQGKKQNLQLHLEEGAPS
jgi:PAS domain S-box-containing protein